MGTREGRCDVGQAMGTMCVTVRFAKLEARLLRDLLSLSTFHQRQEVEPPAPPYFNLKTAFSSQHTVWCHTASAHLLPCRHSTSTVVVVSDDHQNSPGFSALADWREIFVWRQPGTFWSNVECCSCVLVATFLTSLRIR